MTGAFPSYLERLRSREAAELGEGVGWWGRVFGMGEGRRSGDGGVKCEVRLWWTTVRSGQVRNDGGIKMQG